MLCYNSQGQWKALLTPDVESSEILSDTESLGEDLRAGSCLQHVSMSNSIAHLSRPSHVPSIGALHDPGHYLFPKFGLCAYKLGKTIHAPDNIS